MTTAMEEAQGSPIVKMMAVEKIKEAKMRLVIVRRALARIPSILRSLLLIWKENRIYPHIAPTCKVIPKEDSVREAIIRMKTTSWVGPTLGEEMSILDSETQRAV